MCKGIIACYLNLLYMHRLHCFSNIDKAKGVHSPVFSYISISILMHIQFISLPLVKPGH